MPTTTRCQQLQQWLHEVHERDNASVIAHILHCPICQRAQRDVHHLTQLLNDVADDVTPRTNAAQVASRTMALAQERRQRKQRWQGWQWSAVASTAALLLCITWPTFLHNHTQAPSVQNAPRITPHIPSRLAHHVQPRTRQHNVQMVWPSDHVFVISKNKPKHKTKTKRDGQLLSPTPRASKPKKI